MSTTLILSFIIFSITILYSFYCMWSSNYKIRWSLIITLLGILTFENILTLHHLPEFKMLWTQLSIKSSITLSSALILIIVLNLTSLFKRQEKIYYSYRKKEYEKLKAILKSEEQLKHHFAKEIHDGLGPLLSIAQMTISTININDNEQQTDIYNVKNLIDQSITTLSEISFNLSPNTLISLGLYDSLVEFCQRLPKSCPKTQLYSNMEDERLEFEIEIMMYRIICELINNCIKHAKADFLKLYILKHNNYINIKYFDNGIGISEKTFMDFQGNGFLNLKSRIEYLNGITNIYSIPEKGTFCSITIDYHNE